MIKIIVGLASLWEKLVSHKILTQVFPLPLGKVLTFSIRISGDANNSHTFAAKLTRVMAKDQSARIILGLKVRQFRQERGWNFEELRQRTGISISYLNEIEKGKKYPQPENIQKLANALGLTTDFLTSPVLTKQFAPLGELLHSNFLNELPLDLFGIDLQQVIEIIARAPDRVNAFISALLEIARNYALREENFYFAALRAYQELHLNYFEEIEQAAENFASAHGVANQSGGVTAAQLQKLLESEFGYKIDTVTLGKHPELHGVRAVFQAKKRKLLLNPQLTTQQKAFQMAKELGFNVLKLTERPHTSNLLRVGSFEEVLNNYKAAYFSTALLVRRDAFMEDLKQLFQQPTWQESGFEALLAKYEAGPEVLFQRFNVLFANFDLRKVYFLRFIHNLDRNSFDIDKELHLNRKHQPHASGLSEHYCRRWAALPLLGQLHQQQQTTGSNRPLISVQRSVYADSGETYLCLALAKPGHPTPQRNVAIELGILVDDQSRQIIRFFDDPAIPTKTVNVTCERCAIEDCTDRAAAPTVIHRREERKKVMAALKKITG
jgi:XRE family transcriptional regulator, fatty acid utilization regulator